ncbi:amino acid adenylation domain-containing protein [Streptomyces sp. NPDC056061]|uniref:non-ribosomal peptide synthetase n=1 Tax=Streptomyces sp. NPDC056061 TaxID=3345700 RepID=UPI0035D685FD
MTDASTDALQRRRTELAGLEPLGLPTDRPRPAVPDGGTARHTRTVPAGGADALRKTAAACGVVPSVALLALYQLLLGRWSRRRDVAVGTPLDGELVVVRTDLGGDPDLGRLVGRADAALRSAGARPRPPFGELAAVLAPETAAGHHPLVQAVFAPQDAAWEAPEGGCPPDLVLSHAERGAEIHLCLEYRTALFDAATAERFTGALLTLTQAVCANPGATVGRLDLLTPDERDRTLERGRHVVEFPTGSTVAELVAEQAARTPDATAVVFGTEEVGYRELDARVARLARHLRALGVAPDVPVGVCLERGTELIVALLAVLRAGGAFVPLDPEHPAERLAFVLADTAAPVVVTQESLRDRFPGAGRRLVAVDTDREAIAAARDGLPSPAAGPENLAYVLHTSGSTGTPKGVAITVGSLVNLLLGMCRTFPPPACDRVLFSTSSTFDIANVEVFLPLLTGGTLIGADRNQVRTPSALAGLVDRHAVTLVQATPSAWRPLLDALGDREAPCELTLFTAGEALPADLAARMLRVGRRVVNGYGPTETTVYATTAEIRDATDPVPIGRPTANTEVYVVDEADRPVPVGVPGELLIGGAGLARGYLGRPDLTEERFTGAPFPGAAGRVYRTGDLVRWLPDGNLEFLGRLDHQVKVRGFRIEPGEVEAALLAHADVAACVVTAREDLPGGRALVAYCVPVAGRALGVGALREWCGRTLPGYMVPAAFVFLDRLPLTTSGKTDRAALPAPDGDRSGLETGFVAPRTPAERAVARVWAEALWADEVGAHDDFFELGGDSLVATRAALKLQEEFGLEIPVHVLFACSTVETLAKALMTARRGGGFPAP